MADRNNIVFISAQLKVFHPNVYFSLKNAFTQISVDCKELPDTRDIWVRDFLPVRTRTGKFVQFVFNPSYLRSCKYAHLRTEPEVVLPHLGISTKDIVRSPLILDGGSIHIFNNVALVSTRILKENKKYSKRFIRRHLEEVLEVSSVVFISEEPSDIFGHIDGICAPYKYPFIFVADTSCYSRSHFISLLTDIRNAGLLPVVIPYKIPPAVESAVYCYLNFLYINDYIIFPQFNTPLDSYMLSIFKTIHGDRIIPIFCREVAEKGGAIHCITWEV